MLATCRDESEKALVARSFAKVDVHVSQGMYGPHFTSPPYCLFSKSPAMPISSCVSAYLPLLTTLLDSLPVHLSSESVPPSLPPSLPCPRYLHPLQLLGINVSCCCALSVSSVLLLHGCGFFLCHRLHPVTVVLLPWHAHSRSRLYIALYDMGDKGPAVLWSR